MISRSNKYRYFFNKTVRSASKFIFDKIPKSLGYDLVIEWSGNKKRIPCSRIPHLSYTHSNVFRHYRYRVNYKRTPQKK